MSEEWTLDQTLGWVLWRNYEIVSELKQISFGNALVYSETIKINEQNDLLDILKLGRLVCRGSKFGKEDKVRIDSECFYDLKIVTHLLKPSSLRPLAEGKTYWTGIVFKSDDVIKYFPLNPKQIRTDQIAPPSDSNLNKAYLEHIKQCQSDGIIPSWKDDMIAVTKLLGKKPTDLRVKQIRKELAPAHWKIRGRRKSI